MPLGIPIAWAALFINQAVFGRFCEDSIKFQNKNENPVSASDAPVDSTAKSYPAGSPC
jgi:hypothetical protein